MSFPVFLPTTSILQKSLESPVPFYQANIPLEKKKITKIEKLHERTPKLEDTELEHCKQEILKLH